MKEKMKMGGKEEEKKECNKKKARIVSSLFSCKIEAGAGTSRLPKRLLALLVRPVISFDTHG